MKTYDSYKDSGIDWLPVIPETWSRFRLAYNGNFSKGKGIPKSDLASDGLPAFIYGDIYTKYGTQTEKAVRHISEEIAENSVVIGTKDLLFAASGETPEEIGKCVCYTGTETAFAGGDVIIYNQQKFDSVFLSYLFNSYRINEQKAKLSKGQIVVHIYSSQLRDIPFAAPLDKEEQTTIVSYLDRKTAEIDELIADKKRLLELYQEEKTAIINQAVVKGINPEAPMKDAGIEWLGEVPEHWEFTLIKRYCRVTDGSHFSPKTQEIGLPYVSVKDVGENSIDLINCKKISAEDFEILVRNGCKPKIDDILLTKDGTIGRAAIVTDDYDPFVILSSLGLITPNDKLTAKYLYYYLISSINIDQMLSFIHGSALTRLTIEKINNLVVTIPPPEEQQSIVHHIETECSRINIQVERTKKLIELLKEYREALISEVVTGQIKVVEK